MKNKSTTKQCNAMKSYRAGEQGSALVITLLLLTLLSAATVGMVVSTSSDELISGYNRNMRSSFYAADSGLNIARQDTLNRLAALVPVNITNRAVQPISANSENTIGTAINTAYSSYNSINAGQAAGSWPGRYQVTLNSIGRTCLPVGINNSAAGIAMTSDCSNPCTGTGCAANITQYSYSFPYTLTAVGQSRASEQTTLTDTGSLMVNVIFGPPIGTVTSFAAYGFFVNDYTICDGSTLVPGTITGPVFSNGSWNFGVSNTSYIFTDTVGAHSPNFGYQFSNTCKQLNTGTATSGSSSISPTFQSGFQLGQNTVPLPANSYSQLQAVLDGKGADPTSTTAPPAPTPAQMNAVLKNISGTAYPSTGTPSSGVYLPYNTSSTPGCPCVTGGGLYVQGDASVTLTASTDNTFNPAHSLQVVTVLQGSTTTTVKVDLTGLTTKIQQGSTTTTLAGVPSQYDPASGAYLRDATMVYVSGDITSLKGPGSGAAAIQDSAAMTVASAGDIVVTDDLLYKTKPVTLTQNQIPGTPPSTLISGNDNGQVLGLFTAAGDIRLENCNSCGTNLEVDASLATISATGSGGLVNTGNSLDTLTILGGRIQNDIKNINTTTRNVIYDRRFSQGFAPPWFPSTIITPSGTAGTTVQPSVQRVQWLNKTPF